MPVDIVPMQRRHIAGFRAVLDAVARERRYLAFTAAPSPARVRRFVLKNLENGAPNFVAVDDDHVVGWCDVTPRTHEGLRHSGVLGMGVAATHRGRGIGEALLRSALAAALLANLSRVELVVLADNDHAIALYRRFGFESEGVARRYLRLDGVYHDALFMARLKDAAGRTLVSRREQA